MKRAFRRASIPLAFYYAITLGLPLANGAGGPAVLEHALVVLIAPPTLIMVFSLVRAFRPIAAITKLITGRVLSDAGVPGEMSAEGRARIRGRKKAVGSSREEGA